MKKPLTYEDTCSTFSCAGFRGYRSQNKGVIVTKKGSDIDKFLTFYSSVTRPQRLIKI